MKLIQKVFCRGVQMLFRVALPVLPYKNLTILERVDVILPVLKEMVMDTRGEGSESEYEATGKAA